METLKLVIMSIVQGITELLPISSSAHLLLLGRLLDISMSSSLLIFFHLGTTLAILIFFSKEIFHNFFSKEKWSLFFKIAISSIPAGVLGILFDSIISEKLRASWITAVSLIVWGMVMIFTEKKYTHSQVKDLSGITWKQSIIIGFAQAIALIPGTSRSGICTIAGIFLGIDKYTALKYSLMVGLPVMLGGAVLDFSDSKPILGSMDSILVLAITFTIGYLCLRIIDRNSKKNWLTVFGIYRILLGVAILLFAL